MTLKHKLAARLGLKAEDLRNTPPRSLVIYALADLIGGDHALESATALVNGDWFNEDMSK